MFCQITMVRPSLIMSSTGVYSAATIASIAVLTNKRVEVVSELSRLDELTEPIVKIMEKQDVAHHISQSKDGRQLFDTLSKEYNVSISREILVPTCCCASLEEL